MTFLKTSINRPEETFERLRQMIQTFVIPRTPQRLPWAAVRKILHQLLIPRISAHLRLQPVTRKQAEQLDACLSKLVHEYFSWKTRVPFNLLATRTKDHGFEFLSISDINCAITIKGLHKDLNHRIRGMRDVARITTQEWSCQLNQCKPALMRNEPFCETLKMRDWYGPLRDHIPTAWCTAAAYLADLKAAIVCTDQSDLTSEETTEEHRERARRQQREDPTMVNIEWEYSKRHIYPRVIRGNTKLSTKGTGVETTKRTHKRKAQSEEEEEPQASPCSPANSSASVSMWPDRSATLIQPSSAYFAG